MYDNKILRLVEKQARLQRLATLAAGVKAAHPAMYEGDVVNHAQRLDDAIQELDVERNPGSEY